MGGADVGKRLVTALSPPLPQGQRWAWSVAGGHRWAAGEERWSAGGSAPSFQEYVGCPGGGSSADLTTPTAKHPPFSAQFTSRIL